MRSEKIKLLFFRIMLCVTLIASIIMISLSLFIALDIFIPMILIGIGFLSGTVVLFNSKEKAK